VAGAENGNNEAITKGGPNVDADGYYTVQKGDTLSDIAQRAYGDMNKYQDIAKGNSDITNVDQINEGQRIKLDNLNDVGNNGVKGDVTNPSGGGPDKNMATQDFEIGLTSPSGNTLSTAQGFAGGAPAQVDTSAAAGETTVGQPPSGTTSTNAVPPPAPATETAAPTPTTGEKAASSLRNRTARDWLRWAAEGDSSTSASPSATDQAAGAEAAAPTSSPGAAPATNPATNPEPGTPSASDVYDPNDPAQVQSQNSSIANPGMSSTMPSMSGMDMNGVGSMIGQGVGVASDIASGIGGAMGGGGLASGIGGLASGIGSAIGGIFSSRRDVEDWRRYAYPAGGGDDFDPETLPHIPFAGSGNPGPVEYSTSEEYADKARKKMDDVTDLGDDPLSTPMGDWQKQGSAPRWTGDESDEPGYREVNLDAKHGDDFYPEVPGYTSPAAQILQRRMRDGRGNRPIEEVAIGGIDDPDANQDPFDPRLIGASYEDDNSDVVRAFQANLGDTALGAGGGGGGRFDDFSSAAAGFLRTAGRNYSLAEQSELIREGDKGGAGNLRSLDLAGTHYEDMDSLGW
jgi:LysM repeat protein